MPRRGHRPGRRRLSAAQAKLIRERYHFDGATLKRLAEEFGVHTESIRKLLRGQTYRDAGGPIGTRAQVRQAIYERPATDERTAATIRKRTADSADNDPVEAKPRVIENVNLFDTWGDT